MGYAARMTIWNGDSFGVKVGLGVVEMAFPFTFGGDGTLPFVFSRGKAEVSISTVLVERYKSCGG